MTLKITLLKVAVFASFVAVLHHLTTLPSQFSALSPELNAAIEAKINPAVQIPGDAWTKLHASTVSAPMIRSVVMI